MKQKVKIVRKDELPITWASSNMGEGICCEGKNNYFAIEQGLKQQYWKFPYCIKPFTVVRNSSGQSSCIGCEVCDGLSLAADFHLPGGQQKR